MASPKRKRKPSSARSQAAKETQRKISALRALGLIKPKAKTPTKVKRKKPGGSAYKALKRFADVLNNKAVAIKAPKKARKKYKGTFDIKGGRIIVPKSSTAKRVTVSKKTGEITIHRNTAGRKTRDRIVPKNAPLEELPRGKNISYSAEVYGNRTKVRFKTHQDLLDYMSTYDAKAIANMIEIVEDDPDFDDEMEAA